MGPTITFFYVIQDSDGDKSTVDIDFPNSLALTNTPGAVRAFADLIMPMMTGGLLEAGVRVAVDVPLHGPVALLLSDVQEKAEFIFRTAGSFIKRMNLPTFLEDFFNPGTGVVDTTAPEVIAFMTAMEDGLTVSGTLFTPTDYRGDDLVDLEKAVENWGKRRR